MSTAYRYFSPGATSTAAAAAVDPVAVIIQVPGTVKISPSRDFIVRMFKLLRPKLLRRLNAQLHSS